MTTRNFKTILYPLIVIAILLGFLLLPTVSWAHNPPLPASGICPGGHSPLGNICQHDLEPTPLPTSGGVPANATLGTIQFPTGLNLDADSIVNNLVAIILAVAGLLFFFLLLYGGIRYMTAGGDPKNAESARKIITSALIGLLIVVGAYFITSVLGNILGIDFLNPDIPGLD